jgi:putative ABC transport system permease protein
VLIGPHDQDRADLAAIDPVPFAEVATMSDSFFVDDTAAADMAALDAGPRGVLVEADKAESLSIETGDHVGILLARGTDEQTLEEFEVVGRFVRFPGFPQGVDLVVDIGDYVGATGVNRADFFVARTTDDSGDGLSRAVRALESGPAADDPIHIDSTATALDKDQSSLTAFDLRGLVRLDFLFTALMSVVGVAMFVFALMLHRRREYVILRAQGIVRRELRALVLGEAGLVALSGVLAGALVGIGMAHLFVHVLRPLFVLDPRVTLPVGQIVLMTAIPVVAAAIASLAAAALLGRVEPSELLRDT